MKELTFVIFKYTMAFLYLWVNSEEQHEYIVIKSILGVAHAPSAPNNGQSNK
jgi:hypothetical protein